MNRLQLRDKCKARYGLSRFGDEDGLMDNTVVNDLLAEAYRDLAKEAQAIRESFTVNLPLASGGVGTVNLDDDVYEIIPDSVRALNGSTWIPLAFQPEEALRASYGPFENLTSAFPRYWYARTSNTASQHRQMVVFPGPEAAVTSGLRYEAYVYPTTLTDDTDAPRWSAAEHDLLIPWVCWKMAQLELSRGRKDASLLVSTWSQAAETAASRLRESLARFHSPGPPEVRLRHYDYD